MSWNSIEILFEETKSFICHMGMTIKISLLKHFWIIPEEGYWSKSQWEIIKFSATSSHKICCIFYPLICNFQTTILFSFKCSFHSDYSLKLRESFLMFLRPLKRWQDNFCKPLSVICTSLGRKELNEFFPMNLFTVLHQENQKITKDSLDFEALIILLLILWAPHLQLYYSFFINLFSNFDLPNAFKSQLMKTSEISVHKTSKTFERLVIDFVIPNVIFEDLKRENFYPLILTERCWMFLIFNFPRLFDISMITSLKSKFSKLNQ